MHYLIYVQSRKDKQGPLTQDECGFILTESKPPHFSIDAAKRFYSFETVLRTYGAMKNIYFKVQILLVIE